MYTLRRWWDRHWLQFVLVSLSLGAAYGLQYTQGGVLLEAYQSLTGPFQSKPTSEERLTNARTRELEIELKELQSQNQKLQQLLAYVGADKPKGFVAPIIGRSADQWWQQMTLGRGSQDGIKIGFNVMGVGGLVGRVVSVTPRTSRILLISDPSSRVGVLVSRSRHMGYIRGQGSNRAVMQFFDKVPNVRVGDFVATSSVSQLFLSGLPVGRVESLNLTKNPAPEAVIELTAPMSFLEWVIVYPKLKLES
jgi:rod shape-determining protein MreC